MYPIHDTQAAQPEAVPHELTRALIAAAAAIALTGIILAAVVFFTARPAPTVDVSAASTGEVRDGWSSYLGAAARPVEQPVRDGWSSYLLVSETDASTVRDGWMSRYGKDD